MKHEWNYSGLFNVPEKFCQVISISKQLGVTDLLLWCSLCSFPLCPHISVLLERLPLWHLLSPIYCLLDCSCSSSSHSCNIASA